MSLLLKRKQAAEANINLTSLIDVTMTVLIIFIMIAPVIEQGIRVAAPSDLGSEGVQEDKTVKNVMIILERVLRGDSEYGIILLDTNKFESFDNFKVALAGMKNNQPEMIATIKVDPNFRYDYFITLMEIVNDLEIPIAIAE